jgi:hypothetical protein
MIEFVPESFFIVVAPFNKKVSTVWRPVIWIPEKSLWLLLYLAVFFVLEARSDYA